MKTILLQLAIVSLLFTGCTVSQKTEERKTLFTKDWKFYLGDEPGASAVAFDDNTWRTLDLPHDWSIELPFDKNSPTGTGGGALRGGVGWYRKTFTIPESKKDKIISVGFDGIYMNSEVWINGHYLGKRPNGYISFQYDMTPYLNYGDKKNVIAVKADNSEQPNSRWYSGSGIYRNVWLTITNKIHIAEWGTYITTPQVNENAATVNLKISVNIPANYQQATDVSTTIYDSEGAAVTTMQTSLSSVQDSILAITQQAVINKPILWSVDKPHLYKAVTTIISDDKTVDEYITPFGIRYFSFDSEKGFLLNGKQVKINGVCMHHDLGCLGTAINTRALERQLQILKEMGCNGIRTSHNPPAPELLNLCDKMGFIVMDEAFDMWKVGKTKYDYHLSWDQWHQKDLTDQILRDRNHPSVFIWSIGNELMEQWEKKDSLGINIAQELASIVRSLDTTRPVTAACNPPSPGNPITKSGALDLVGYNYAHKEFPSFPERFPGKKFIATETVSALATRGHYDMPGDSIRRWPVRWDLPFTSGNMDTTCSAYDNCSAPWGSTHEETWKIMKKYDFLSGMYIWTGFDYIGEPTPYSWPARSSYFGIVDLAGFPKDAYYMYQSEWTDKNVLHVFPHWNWNKGDTVDVWAYYNNADEVELFLNGKSLGTKRKTGDDLHVWWRVAYEPGIIKAISRRDGKEILEEERKTAGKPAKIILKADRETIKADGNDLSFVTVSVIDSKGNTVPDADNLIQFKIEGNGFIAGTDNGSQTDLSSFKSDQRKMLNGLCLAVVQSRETTGTIRLTATATGLESTTILIEAK